MLRPVSPHKRPGDIKTRRKPRHELPRDVATGILGGHVELPNGQWTRLPGTPWEVRHHTGGNQVIGEIPLLVQIHRAEGQRCPAVPLPSGESVRLPGTRYWVRQHRWLRGTIADRPNFVEIWRDA